MNFWKQLKKPILCLAPMDDVTDVVFREMITKTARPDVFFTEFTNVEGLNSSGQSEVLSRLKFSENQRPIVAQIWGLSPENFYLAAKLIKKMSFDGIDINMGCPDKSVIRDGTCSALINNHSLAKEIIEATQKGAGHLPVSVKTRIGFRSIQTEEWIGFLLGLNLAAITIHGRTTSEKSKVPAHWDEIQKAVKLRDQLKVGTLIIGNGDVEDRMEALQKIKEYQVDGVMIGRGIFQNLWAFADKKPTTTPDQMLALLLEHTKLFHQTWGSIKNFAILRKFYKIYTLGFNNAISLRDRLMQSSSIEEVTKIIKDYQS